MKQVLSYIFLGFQLIGLSVYGQNCWEYEETEPIARLGGSVVISELYFDTHYTEKIETKYHHFGEYVELFNSSTESISLEGWYIKDHESHYNFPNVSIESGDFLIITYAGRLVDNRPEAGMLRGEEKFIELFPEAEGLEDKILLQNNFVMYNQYATIKLYNKNHVLIDQVNYKGQTNDAVEPGYNYVGELNNHDGGVFNGPIFTDSDAKADYYGYTPQPGFFQEYKKAIYIANSIDYYDHEDLDESYLIADATPFSIPYSITLQEPSDIIESFPPPLPPTIANFNSNVNHIYTESFDVNGNMIAKSGSYYNGFGKSTIIYNWDKETNRVWGTETKYDKQGRNALQSLVAPSCNGFVVNPQYLWGSYTTYVNNDSDYNLLNDISIPQNDYSSLQRYYSDENSNESLQATTTRPYARTVYDKLNPGNIIKVIGGNQMEDEWKNSYSFTIPAAQEMYYIFGKDYFDGQVGSLGEEVITTFFKTISIDAHGNEHIIFKNAKEKTVAVARSGGTQNYEVVSLIGEQGYIDVHIPKNITTVNFLTSISDYTVYDLKTGNIISTSAITGGNVYRIVSTPSSSSVSTYISSSGSINAPSGARGIRYNVNYHDYAINYYDDIGRLKQVTQPLGFNASCLSSIQNTVTHGMMSSYEYNALGQLIGVDSPDKGISKAKYRNDGRTRFTQSNEQELLNEVSFTDYDELARPIKNGVGIANFNALDPNTDVIISGLKEIQEILYDTADPGLTPILISNGFDPADYKQSFLSGNVSMTQTRQTPSSEAISTTWYNYDGYGRVVWLAQNIDGLGLKTIHYKYDYKGNISEVIYQKDNTDERFIHRYSYNHNNSLVLVQTSTNGTDFKEQAKYEYYKTGKLKRTEVANGLQGIDYVYTIGGQLKSINSPNLNIISDPGRDANDMFGITLDYYSGDYLRSGSPIQTSPSGMNRYDGNIKATRWATRGLTQTDGTLEENVIPDAYTYFYDSNKWLTGADYGSTDASAMISTGPDYKVSNITYDANGNLITLKRTKNDTGSGNLMDDFVYNRNPGTNQINYILDSDPSPSDADDFESQSINNYSYNSIGQLITNMKDEVSYEYNALGLVTRVKDLFETPIVEFEYDDKGQRISKQSYSDGVPTNKSFYIRDARGNPLAIYSNSLLVENPIYGTSRIGVHFKADDSNVYQLSDHLGNVRAVVRQEAGLNPVTYEEDFDDATSVSPWLSSLYASVSVEDQRLKCVITRNWNYAYLKVNLDAGKKYQFSYTLDRHAMQSSFQLLMFEPGSSTHVYNSGAIPESGHYTFSYTPGVSGLHTLRFRGWISGYPTGVDFLQANTFYLDNILIKDTTVESFAHADYYPFGMPMPNRINGVNSYRYAYQGQEKDPETNMEAFKLRLWDGRIGRWLTTDPYGQYHSPYLGMGNDPINGIDPDGGFRTRIGAWLYKLFSGLKGAEIVETENPDIKKQRFSLSYSSYDKECNCNALNIIVGADWQDNKLPLIQLQNPSVSINNRTGYVYTRRDLRKRRILTSDSNVLGTALKKMERRGVFEPIGLYDWIDYYGIDVYNNNRFFNGFYLGFSLTGLNVKTNSLLNGPFRNSNYLDLGPKALEGTILFGTGLGAYEIYNTDWQNVHGQFRDAMPTDGPFFPLY